MGKDFHATARVASHIAVKLENAVLRGADFGVGAPFQIRGEFVPLFCNDKITLLGRTFDLSFTASVRCKLPTMLHPCGQTGGWPIS